MELISVREAARIAGCPVPNGLAARRRGEVEAVRVGNGHGPLRIPAPSSSTWLYGEPGRLARRHRRSPDGSRPRSAVPTASTASKADPLDRAAICRQWGQTHLPRPPEARRNTRPARSEQSARRPGGLIPSVIEPYVAEGLPPTAFARPRYSRRRCCASTRPVVPNARLGEGG